MADRKPKVGMIVKRGPNWKWGRQDEYDGVPQKGIITRVKEEKEYIFELECTVRWDKSHSTNGYSLIKGEIEEVPKFFNEELEI